MPREYTDDDLTMVKYFHEEKCVESYVCWEDIKESIFRDFPHFEKALNDVVISNKMLDAVVDSLDID